MLSLPATIRGVLALGLFHASPAGHPVAVGVAVYLHIASLQVDVVRDHSRFVLQRLVVGSPLVGILLVAVLRIVEELLKDLGKDWIFSSGKSL